MSWMEGVATLFGVACVWLTIRRNIWCWPTGLIQVLIYIQVFFAAKLYSDMLLQVIYVALQIYGWAHWRRGGGERPELPLTSLGKNLYVWLVVGAVGATSLGFAMARLTDAALPYWDAVITSLSLVAQWLMTRKKVESWLFWIAVDGVALFVYGYKRLYFTTGLYALFLGMAYLGWKEWKRALENPSLGAPVA